MAKVRFSIAAGGPSGRWAERNTGRKCGGWILVVWPGAPPGSPPAFRLKLFFLVVFLFRFVDYQIVGHSECAIDAVGFYAGDLFVHLVGDCAFERDLSILDDDVNGRNGAHLVGT